jgi:hypothetical protein
MRIAIQRLGKAENMSFGEIPATGLKDAEKYFEQGLKKLRRFERMIDLIFILSDQEVIEVQQLEENGKDERYLVIDENVPKDLRPLLDELSDIIGLSRHNRFRVTERVANIEDDEITIQTRSVMAMMEFMSRGLRFLRSISSKVG